MATTARPEPAAAIVGEPVPSRYVYDARLGRYRSLATGRLVRESAIRDVLDRVLATAEDRLGALADALRSRTIGPREWERRMREATKLAHLHGYAAAKGGWAQLAPSDYGRIGNRVRTSYAWLRRFRRQLERGDVLLDGRYTRRMQLYVEGARLAFHEVERGEKQSRGFTRERNQRAAADSCSGCVGETARGWVPIGQLVPPGRRTCGVACKCRVLYDKDG